MDVIPAQEFSETSSRFGWKKFLLVFFVIIILLTGIFVVVVPFLAEPTSLPREIFITNITEGQATITWSTEKPTKGAIKIQKDIYKDDGDKNKKSQGFYATHHVTVDALRPATAYKYEVYQGWRKVSEGSFTTATILNSINNPNPVYGKVVDAENRPQVGAIVYLTAKNPNGESALYSTLTNNEGRWQIDLANFRTRDLKAPFGLTAETAQEAVVQTGFRGKFKAATNMDNDQPWPDIIIK